MARLSDKEFARAALDAGLIKPRMVKECAALQKRIVKMGRLPKNLKDILVEKGYIAEDVARRIARGDKPEEAKKKEKAVRIGGYEVLSRLGKGQMGSVYKARQISLDRVVALKVLPSHFAGDKRYVARFLRESKAAGRLNHPNIVTAVDFGESDGLYYYAMDYVEGVNIGSILEEEGKLREEEALAIALQMARALEHAHEHNIIHRDIKPENIMLDTEGQARLCDLGLAREASEQGALTQVGVVLGTPYYVSPEQAEGRGDLDTRSDIYSLGVTLFHMVTGEVPFKGPTGPAIMVKHINEEMPDPREFNPKLSRGTAQLIKKMTAKKRERRYQVPAEVIKDIERVIAGERPAAAGRVIRARRPRRRQGEEVTVGGGRKLIPLVVIGVIVLVIIVVISSLPESDWQQPAPGGPPGAGTADTADTTGLSRGRERDTGMTPAAGGTRRPEGRLSSDQREIMRLMDWARTHPNETADAAGKYRGFIETASDPKAKKNAQDALEGLASREFLSLESRFNSLLATGKVDDALEETVRYLKLYADTKPAQKVAALVNKAKKEREKKVDATITKAISLANEKKFKDALDLLAEISETAPKELKRKLASAIKRIEKTHEEFLAGMRAKAAATRPQFEKKLSERIAGLHLDEALLLIDRRIGVEGEHSIVQKLRAKASDLRQAKQALELVMANMKNIAGMRRTFKIKKKGSTTGTIQKVRATSFLFNMGAVVREVKLNELGPEDIVRLAELDIGPDEAETRFQLGLLFLLVLGDPQTARTQFARAGELGADTSRFQEMLNATHIEELIAEARKQEKRKKFLPAAFTYSSVLSRIADSESYADRKDEFEGNVEYCLRESGVQNVFQGRVSIEDGKLVVFYDFSDPGQWQDFEGYILDKQLKRPMEWLVDKGVLIGKGSESVLWKGRFSGDVTVQVDATPKSPRQPAFFMRLCDDGKGFKGKNYSFGFGYRERVKVGQRGRQIIYRQTSPQIIIARWRSKKFDILKRSAGYPVITAGRTYKIKIQRTGSTMRTTIDGTKIVEARDKAIKKGGTSLKVLNSTVHFDNLRITGDFDQAWLSREIRKAK